MDSLKLTLRENAIDSLEMALYMYLRAKDGKNRPYKWAILSLAHFVELSIKQFILNISPALIFKNCFKKKINKDFPLQTIEFSEGINFLYNHYAFNEDEFGESDFNHLDYIRKIRNEIEHYAVDLDKNEFIERAGLILKIMRRLYEIHDKPLDKIIENKETIKQFYKIIDDYDSLLRDAQEKAKCYGEQYECVGCSNNTCVYFDKHMNFKCLFCDSEFESGHCRYCGTHYPKTGDDDNGYCSEECLQSDMHHMYGAD